jgi:hypothetical protein
VLLQRNTIHSTAAKLLEFVQLKAERSRAGQRRNQHFSIYHPSLSYQRSTGYLHVVRVRRVCDCRQPWFVGLCLIRPQSTFARSEPDPMIAAQKLRDFAISYGTICTSCDPGNRSGKSLRQVPGNNHISGKNGLPSASVGA